MEACRRGAVWTVNLFHYHYLFQTACLFACHNYVTCMMIRRRGCDHWSYCSDNYSPFWTSAYPTLRSHYFPLASIQHKFLAPLLPVVYTQFSFRIPCNLVQSAGYPPILTMLFASIILIRISMTWRLLLNRACSDKLEIVICVFRICMCSLSESPACPHRKSHIPWTQNSSS